MKPKDKVNHSFATLSESVAKGKISKGEYDAIKKDIA